MRRIVPLLAALLAAGCGKPAPKTEKLPDARRGFASSLKPTPPGRPAQPDPDGRFQLVKYPSPAGLLAAYVSADPGDGKKHPAIVWITGGDCNSVDAGVWEKGPAKNDQSAAQYLEAGVVTMYPALRGGSGNPGRKEGFLGEVDDVIAAGDYLAKLPYVDPQRVYLGGHSTGGTLALLVAESTGRFRAVFSFGPVDDVSGYGPGSEFNPFNDRDAKEVELRSPVHWQRGVTSPTFVVEGAVDGNADAVEELKRASSNPLLRYFVVPGRDHFSVLAPANKVLAAKVVADAGAECNIALSDGELR